jgi:hypothetical protein
MSCYKILKDEKGILTLDFVFASVIIFSFTAILFSFAMTFSVVEVVQYISYSSSRSYSLAHLNQQRQRDRAQSKFDELSTNPVITSFFSAGWFEILPAQISDFNGEYSPDPSLDSDIFLGVRIPFSAPILYKRVPLLGTTGSDPDAFRANISSFLSREPTFTECRELIEQRATQFTSLGYNFDVGSVAVMMDNGC